MSLSFELPVRAWIQRGSTAVRDALRRGWSRLPAGLRERASGAVAAVAGWGPVRRVRAHPVRWALGAAAVVVLASITWAETCGLRGCPSAEELRAFRPDEGGPILDRHGELLGHLRPVRRVTVPLAKIPRRVQQAFIAVEDRRFLAHHGFDWHGALRATWSNLRHFDLREGSSTITMQAARSAFLTEYEGERSVRRKLIELSLARRLERALTKPQILELYLNTIYLGDGTYGVEAASRHYFGKPVEKLGTAEAALLAGLPRAPSAYHPRRNPARARARRDLVLAMMTAQGFLDVRTADAARRAPVRTSRRGWSPVVVESDVLELVRAGVDSLARDRNWRMSQLVVRTTLDRDAQRAAERAVRDRAAAISRSVRGREGTVQGAMAALDPATGELRAIVGAAIYRAGGFHRATSARRQPGSAFKPFVYAAALENGWTPESEVEDAPIELVNGGRRWAPANWDGEHWGTLTMRDALAQSRNTAAVRVSQAVGLPKIVALAQRTGITSPLQPLPALALGAAEVTPLELVTAYAAFGNGGRRVTPSLITQVETTQGEIRWTRPAPVTQPALDPRDAFLLTTMLQAAVDEGTGQVIRELGVNVPVAGKTGTTNDGADVWFVGYTRTLVAGFWFGRDTPRSLGGGASGARLAAPAWAAFYNRGWNASQDEEGWEIPPGLEQVMSGRRCGFLGLGWCEDGPAGWRKQGADGERPWEIDESDTMAPPEPPQPPEPPSESDLDMRRWTERELRRRSAEEREALRSAEREIARELREAEQELARAGVNAEVRRAIRQALQEAAARWRAAEQGREP